MRYINVIHHHSSSQLGVMSSGVVDTHVGRPQGSWFPMLDFTQGVVAPHDGHPKWPRGRRSPWWNCLLEYNNTMHLFMQVYGVEGDL